MTRIATRYYDILEVPRKAKKEEIKEACASPCFRHCPCLSALGHRYRRLAKRYHPDRNVDDPEANDRTLCKSLR